MSENHVIRHIPEKWAAVVLDRRRCYQHNKRPANASVHVVGLRGVFEPPPTALPPTIPPTTASSSVFSSGRILVSTFGSDAFMFMVASFGKSNGPFRDRRTMR
jgi:hypothetical protein